MKRIAQLLLLVLALAVPGLAQSVDSTYLGRLSTNRHDSRSIGNPYGNYGSPNSPKSITNPYGDYGIPYSPRRVTNPYATNSPRAYGSDGRYLGKVSSNPFDPESVSNPYGSPYSPKSWS